MNVVSAQTSSGKRVDELRAQHQKRARLAAVSREVPKAFRNDPTFLELVSKQGGKASHSTKPAPDIGSGLLAETGQAKELDRFRGPDLDFVWDDEPADDSS